MSVNQNQLPNSRALSVPGELASDKTSIVTQPVTGPLAGQVQAANGPEGSFDQFPAGGRFFWEGRSVYVAGVGWKLLHCLWMKPYVPFAELGRVVWRNEHPHPKTIRSSICRLNQLLQKAGATFHFSVRGNRVIYEE